MVLFRSWFRRTFRPYLKNLSQEETQKLLALTRIAYCFGAGSLFIFAYHLKKEADEKAEALSGAPTQALSTLGKTWRDNRQKPAMVYEYDGSSLKRVYFDKEQYYKQLEEMAYQKTKEAQEKVLAEGGSLPEGATNLVET